MKTFWFDNYPDACYFVARLYGGWEALCFNEERVQVFLPKRDGYLVHVRRPVR